MNRRRSGGKRAQSWWALLQSKATKGVQANFTCLFLILVVSVFQYISFSVLVLYSSGCIENDRRAWRDMYSVVQLQIAGLHGEISGGGDGGAVYSGGDGGLGHVARSFWKARRCPSHDAAWTRLKGGKGGSFVAPGIGRLATVSEVESVEAIPELAEWHNDGRRRIALRRNEWDAIFLLRLLRSHGISQSVDAMVWATRGGANGTYRAYKANSTLGIVSYLAERNVRVCVTEPYMHGKNGTKKRHPAYKHLNVQTQQEDLHFLSPDLYQRYDFTFAAFALDDMGSVSLGMRFVIESLSVLRRGGLGVFVAELDLAARPGSSGRVVWTPAGDVVVWTRDDLLRLSKDVAQLGYEMGEICWAAEKDADRLLPPTHTPRVVPPPAPGTLEVPRAGPKLILATVGFWIKKPRMLRSRPARLPNASVVNKKPARGRCSFKRGYVSGKKKKKGPLPIFITDQQRPAGVASFLHNPARKAHQYNGEHL